MLLNNQEGLIASTPQLAEQAHAAGYIKCHTPNCQFWISPEGQHDVEKSGGGYYTCPRCQKSYNLIHEIPWMRPGMDDYEFQGYGGGTSVSGLSVNETGQLGESIVEGLKDIPGYGPITWWHQGGATAASPLDGTTKDWGIEVKSTLYDSIHHRFIAGGVRNGGTRNERESKNTAAQELGKQGILGLLVVLDMRRSVADIYAKEMPLAGWQTSQGRPMQGIANFRTNSAQHLIKEVPFKNPFMDPSHPAPHGPELGTANLSDQGSEMPF